jgi:succinate-acetate transporter protein
VGVSEHYDSQTGAPLGVPNLGMSAVLLTMALEGLSPRHAIRVA